jgi:hypothetical protein
MLNRSVIYLVAGTQGMIPTGEYTGPNGIALDVSELRIAGVASVMRAIGAKPDDVLSVDVDTKKRTVAVAVSMHSTPGEPSIG